jgi:predicted AAA+ superfamily ATPase
MKIIYIKLTNFIGVHAAMGLKEVEFSFDNIDKPIIQIYGKNRCGKTVLIQQLHPFSSINLNGDERSDLSLILPQEHLSKD